MTSPVPISETTPVVPLTVPDTGTATDIFFTVAEESIAVEMAEVAVAACFPTRSDPDERALYVEVDLDDTQVFEPGGNRWKQDDVAKEMLTS